MASEDFLILLSVVFKKLYLALNEFFCCWLPIPYQHHQPWLYQLYFYVYTVMARPKYIAICIGHGFLYIAK